MSELSPVEKLIDFETPVFSRAFVVVDLLPSLVLIAGVATLLMAGAPGRPPSGARFVASLGKVTSTSVFLCVVGGFVLATALHPLGLRLRRLLSGNTTLRVVEPLLSFLRSRQRRRFKVANERIDASVTPHKVARARWTEIYSREFPAPAFLAPSRLGNALEALRSRTEVEQTVDDVVTPGSDSASAYRAAYLRAHDEKLRIALALDDCRLKLAAAERYSLAWAMVGISYIWLLIDHGWWLLLAVPAFLLSRLAYLGAVQSVVEYSYRIDDLYQLLGSSIERQPPGKSLEGSA